jgi:cellulose synthase/poly-beta-1,6-N-acetylglucosamine synthase-like glycosyltransferase
MDLLLILFFTVYGLLLGTIVFAGYFSQLRKEKSYKSSDSLLLKDVGVVIPFRNEEKRINVLLESIIISKELPATFIFVDDHSTDATLQLIQEKLSHIDHVVIQMPDGKQGKKEAIREGIRHTQASWILSMDADISFSPDYFEQLMSLSNADMYILPAILVAEKGGHHLFEVDLILVNAANCGISGHLRPILASGANLLYRKDAFERLDNFSRHAYMPSGDDIYLLRDFREGGAEIRLMTSTDFSIRTETPQSFKEFIHQRLRWIAKTGDVKDHLSTGLAIIQVILSFTFVVLMISLGVVGEWKLFLVTYLAKTALDMLIFLPFFDRIKRMRSWLFIPLYEIIFPFYSLMILLMMYFFKPEWKGRKLERNF